MPQAGLLGANPDPLMEFDGRRNGEDGGEIHRARMHARANIVFRPILIGLVAIDIGEAVLGDIEAAAADRRADPFVQVEADEVDAESAHVEFHLAPGMSRVDVHIDAMRLRPAGDLGDRDDEPGAVAEMREEARAWSRIWPREGRLLGIEQALAGGRFGEVDLDHIHDASPLLQPLHRILHRIIVEIGIEHGVSRRQRIVAGDQELQGVGGATRQRDLFGRDADGLRHPVPHLGEIVDGVAARIEGVVGVRTIVMRRRYSSRTGSAMMPQ